MLEQLAADAGSAQVGIDEQRFHVRAVDQHETLRPVLVVDRHDKWGLGQEAGNFSIDRLAVIGAEEVMGSVDGATPEIDESVTIGGAGRA